MKEQPPLISMEHKITIENLPDLTNKMTEVVKELNPKKKKIDWALIVSITAVAFTIYWSYASQANQKEMQAYANWQNFLSLAVDNPELANGYKNIDGKSIAYLADKSNRDELMKNDSLTYHKYAKYTWFVAAALGSAESVVNLQTSDTSWNNTIVEAFRGHKALFDAKVYDLNSYDPKFRTLIERAFQSKR